MLAQAASRHDIAGLGRKERGYNPADVSSEGIPFGEYRLLRRLGSGGMAEVFLAKKTGPGGFEKQLVLKRILPHLTASEHFTTLFLKEARLAALIDHPNLVHVSGFGQIDGNYYLAMEYVDGITLAELLDMLGTLTPGVASRVGIDLLGALSAIHAARNERGESLGLVHRDVTPRNVMVTREGGVKLLDFGIAVSKDEVEISSMGTRRHMSPEQIRGDSLDARSDLFCVAVLIYEMIAGEPPFEGAPRPSPVRPPSIPPELWTTIERTLRISPDERPANARQIQAELELFVASRGIEGTRAHLADLVAAMIPSRSSPTRRALSRFTGRTMTRIRRLTMPLSLSSSGANEAGANTLTSPLVGRRKRMLAGAAVAITLALALGFFVTWVQYERAPDRPLAAIDLLWRRNTPAPTSTAAPAIMPPIEETPTPPAPAPAAEPTREEKEPEPREKRTRAKESAPKTGTLTIDTRPWTEVYLGGKKLGLTPMEGVKLPAGKHELELRNPKVGLVRRIQVTIRAGKVTRVQRDL
jgi:eukaryotic-like serine/threonine-protein kinase